MFGTIIYILTTLFVIYTLYNYFSCKEQSKITNCFDEGAEEFLSLIDSKEYEYH